MGSQNIGVLRVDQGVLKALVEEGFGVAHEVLVQRVVQCYQNAERTSFSPATSSCLLPGAGDSPRIAGKDRCLQVADVYSKLHGVGGYHTGKLAVE